MLLRTSAGYFLAFCIPFFLFLTTGTGQVFKPRIETFPPESYGESDQVFCLERDPYSGGIFFGSVGAMPYYNGAYWEKFPTVDGMALFDIEIDDNGRIWIAGHSNFGYLKPPDAPLGMQWKNPLTSKTKVAPDSLPPDYEDRLTGLHHVSLMHLVPDSLRDFDIIRTMHVKDERLFFNASRALFMLDSSGLSSILPRESFGKSFHIGNEVWIQERGKGLFVLDGDRIDTTGQGKLREEAHFLKGSEDLKGTHIRAILPEVPGITSKKEYLVVTRKKGLFILERKAKGASSAEVRTFRSNRDNELGTVMSATALSGTAPHEEGRKTKAGLSSNTWNAVLTLATRDQGLNFLNTKGELVLSLGRDEGLPSDYVWQAMPGAPGSGNLWCVTNKGIARIGFGDPRTYAYEGEDYVGNVRGITRYRDRLFFGSDQGVHSLPAEQAHLASSSIERLKSMETFQLITPDPLHQEGGILVGGKDLYQLELTKGAARWSQLSPNVTQYLVTEDGPEGHRWMIHGGRAGCGLMHWSEKEAEWKDVLFLTELPEQRPQSLELDVGPNTVRIWCGLRTRGALQVSILRDSLTSLHDKNGRLKELSFKKVLEGKVSGVKGQHFKREGILGKGVYFFKIEGKVRATGRKGIFQPEPLKGRSDSFRFRPDSSFGASFTGKRKKQNGGRPVFLMASGWGRSIWIGSDNTYQLGRYRKKKGHKVDSLPFMGLDIGSLNSLYPDEDSILWIGGSDGIVRYNARVKKSFDRAYTASIRRVRGIFQEEDEKRDSVLYHGFPFSRKSDDPLLDHQRDTGQGSTPRLSYSLKNLRFRFASPFFERSEALSYRYRLRGFEEEWSSWKKKTFKEYTNLAEGAYAFQVKAKNVYGKESRMASYRFRILPPWYRTWPAYSAYTITGIGFFWILLWLNGRRLRAQKEKLERTVEQRTREIQQKNQELEQEKQEVKDQKEQVEAAHQEIEESIDYARTIQQALLQAEEQISPHLPEHFILFKPQAKVSGDFYWAREQQGHLYIAAVDCTGHGVPGAFMSMLGISQLNEIMNSLDTPSPGEVLTNLRERVVRELSGAEGDHTAKDGMDAALLKVPLTGDENKTIEFAGAQNPLYVVREGIAADDLLVRNDRDRSVQDRLKPFRKSSDGIEIKGDPMPVGYDEYAEDDFATFPIQVQKGDMLYIFSDGYADQFGGPKGKKFRYGPFKQLLVSISGKTLEEQKKELDRNFEEWKAEGQQEQIDDVVVIGVRL